MRKSMSVALMLVSVSLLVSIPLSASIERNSRAFLFVLEFALGAPLTRGQEEIVLTELRRGWQTRSQQELSKFDAYPRIVDAIVRATDRQALEDLRRKLEQSVREWLAQSDRTDTAVAAVSAQLKQKGRVLISGNPPLTVMAADAYSEMYAYSELLQKSPDALPRQVSAAQVARTKGRLLKAWARFTHQQRGQVTTTPGLWISLRSVLEYGKAADRSEVLSKMKEIAAPREAAPSSEAAGGGSSGGGSAIDNLVKHQVLMNVQNLTFHEYLFCHNFTSSIF